MFIPAPFINVLNKWKGPRSPLPHSNLNAAMWKINSISLAAWGASGKHSWLVMQIKELRGFHCPKHFFFFFRTLLFFPHVSFLLCPWRRCSKQRWQWPAPSLPQPPLELVWAQKPLRNGFPAENAHFPSPTCCLLAVPSDMQTHTHVHIRVLCPSTQNTQICECLAITCENAQSSDPPGWGLGWCLQPLHPSTWTSAAWTQGNLFTSWGPQQVPQDRAEPTRSQKKPLCKERGSLVKS